MGASTKRKKDKAKDFVKPKLRVGKTKPKASNATDTSFRAKSIVLNQQSLSTTAPTVTSAFNHSLSLLSSKSSSQKKDALSSLLHYSPPCPAPTPTILLALRPLFLDTSSAIRGSALQFLSQLPPADITANISLVLIYLHIGLTHLVSDIRSFILDVLSFLVAEQTDATITAPGGFTGTLTRLISALGWTSRAPATSTGGGNSSGWTSAPPSTSSSSNAKLDSTKLRAKQLTALAALLEAGLASPTTANVQALRTRELATLLPIRDGISAHGIGDRADPYAYLGLFDEDGMTGSGSRSTRTDQGEGMILSDAGSRSDWFVESYAAIVEAGVKEAAKEGGEVGRAAKSVMRAAKLVATSHG